MFPQSMPSRMASRSSSQPSPVLALVSMQAGETASWRNCVHAGGADPQAAGITGGRRRATWRSRARRAEVAVPLAERFEEVLVLRIEHQHRQRGFIHEKLMDQPWSAWPAKSQSQISRSTPPSRMSPRCRPCGPVRRLADSLSRRQSVVRRSCASGPFSRLRFRPPAESSRRCSSGIPGRCRGTPAREVPEDAPHAIQG